MSENRALWAAGRSRGEDDDGGIVFITIDDVSSVRFGAAECQLIEANRRDVVRYERQTTLIRYYQPRSHRANYLCDDIASPPSVAGTHHPSLAHARPKHHDPLDRVRP
jgi:hypothetical protein